MIPSIFSGVKRQRRAMACFSLMGALMMGALLFSTSHRQEAAAAIDTTAPIVAITKPTGGSMVRSSVAVVGTASDIYPGGVGSGISLVEVKVSDDSYAKATPRATGDWSTWSHSVTFTTTGWKSIIAKATDKAGNQAWFTITVYNDISPPSVTISSPTASSTSAAVGSRERDNSC